MPNTDLATLGEFGLIDSIAADTIVEPATVIQGIGDDCALYRTGTPSQLVTTDMMVEGVHFTRETMGMHDIGHRCMAANLSDIAAMGGKPTQAVVSLAIPLTYTAIDIQDIYEGMKALASQHRVNIIGGDTVQTAGPLVLSITVVGDTIPLADHPEACLRSHAQAGDRVGVIHYLGSASVGLETILAGREDYPHSQRVHRRPAPQVEAGQHLRREGAHAMNDISDGLASELWEIAKNSDVAIHIIEDKIPLHRETKRWAAETGTHPYDYAWYGGEDFELVFTMGDKEACLLSPEHPVTWIGYVREGAPSVTAESADGSCREIVAKGYNHFTGKGEERC